MENKTRIDKYLWAIRVFKTRSQATRACDDGKVKVEGVAVKPSKIVAIGDVLDIKAEGRKWTIEVTGIIQNRVKYEEAVKNYIDLTSEEDKQYNTRLSTSFYTGKRLSKTGRPTKKQRRDLDDIFNELPE
ncbi:MAG: RNA-binding S4 domain-containing protein [Taibaiella sp.]|nr:RNA-binding S4 domain-containing protein [Taibaiella sp.]